MLSKELGRPIAFTERTVEEDTQEMVDAGLPEPVAAMNAQAVSLIAEGEAAWLSGDVAAVLDHPARSFGQFAADNATAFSSAA